MLETFLSKLIIGGIALVAVVALVIAIMANSKKEPNYAHDGLKTSGVLQTTRYFDGIQGVPVTGNTPQAKYTPADWRKVCYARGTPIYTSEVRKIEQSEMPSGQSPPYARAMIFTMVPWVTPDGAQVMQRAHYEGLVMTRHGRESTWTPWVTLN